MGGKLLTYRPSSQRKPFEVHYARTSKCSARSVDRCLQCPGTPQFVAALKQLNRDRKPVLGQAGAWRWVMPHRRTAPPLLRRTCSHAFNGLLRLCPPQLVQSGCQDMAEISEARSPSFLIARLPDLPPRPLMAVDFAIHMLARPARWASLHGCCPSGRAFCATLVSDPGSRRRPCAALILRRRQADRGLAPISYRWGSAHMKKPSPVVARARQFFVPTA
jgi:hypothetical protein